MKESQSKLDALMKHLKVLGHPLEHHPALTSTNDRVLALAREGAPEGAVVVADRQTAGRGRHGRSWASPEGGLYVSVLLRPEDDLLKKAPLSLIAALAASEALDAAARVATTLKWPNDILLDGKKVGGVLVDVTKDREKGNLVVVGVGLNLNVKPDDLGKELAGTAVSVLAAKKRTVSIEQCLRLFLGHLESHYEHAQRGGGPLLLSRAADRMPMLNGRVRVRLEGRTVEGQANGLSAVGALVVTLDGGGREVIYAGEVEEVRPA